MGVFCCLRPWLSVAPPQIREGEQPGFAAD
jgi:hypothetical protein